MDAVQLAMLCLLSCFLGCGATPVEAKNPMVCGSHHTDQPHLFRLNNNYTCPGHDKTDPTRQPQQTKIMVYKPNTIEWESPAYQCKKFKSVVTTLVSLFTDVKVRNAHIENRPITRGECIDMVASKHCDAGELKGGNGVFTTRNKVEAVYKHCCKKQFFSKNQCSIVRATVYKRHEDKEFESTAGDVRHCKYDEGSCKLDDGSILIWEPRKQTHCKHTEWYMEEGTFFDNHFVSSDHSMALTFARYGINSTKDCHGKNTSMSDQGLMLRFMTPLHNVTIRNNVTATYQIVGQYASTINAIAQALALEQITTAQKLFWTSYYYSCHNTAQTINLITLLLERHPTTAARHMLQLSNVVAKAGPGYLEVYPCTELERTSYQLLKMEHNNCTNYLPIQISIAGLESIGYLDPIDNIIHPDSYNVDCTYREEVPVKLDGIIYLYSWNDSLKLAPNTTTLSLPNIKLGATPLELHENIFSRAHRLNWADFSHHHSLNAILSTLNRQAQVLKAVGVVSSPHHTLRKNRIETQEGILGNSYFSFLFGGHVASVYELWTMLANLIVTIATVAFISKKLYSHLCVKYICKRRGRIVVDAVDTLELDRTQHPAEEITPATELHPLMNPTHPQAEETIPNSNINSNTPPARLYPALEEMTGTHDIAWPSWTKQAGQ